MPGSAVRRLSLERVRELAEEIWTASSWDLGLLLGVDRVAAAVPPVPRGPRLATARLLAVLRPAA